MTQVELARRAKTSQPSIARLEADQLSPSVRTVELLLDALGLRLELATAEKKAAVDRTLIAQILRLTPTDRLRKLKQEYAAIQRLRLRG